MSQRHVRFDVCAGAGAPGEARRRVVEHLRGWGFLESGWLDAAAVVVSELVTNAVQHGKVALVTVEVNAIAAAVLLSVADDSDAVPRPRAPDDRGGRGLMLIEALSSRWHVQDRDSGKYVHVELKPYGGRPRSTFEVDPHS